MLCFLLLVPLSSPLQAMKTLFIIESFRSDFDWSIAYREGLEQELREDYRIEFFSLQAAALSPQGYHRRVMAAWRRYTSLAPDVVVLADDDALQSFSLKLAGLGVPVIYLGINDNPRNYRAVGHDNMTGVLERPLLKRSMVQLSKLVKMKKVLLLFDDSLSSRAIHQEVFYGRSALTILGVKARIELAASFESWQQRVREAKAQGYDAIYIGLYQALRNAQGEHVADERVLQWVSEHAPVPLFTFYDFAVSETGAIGGYVISGKDQGIAAAQAINQIDSGTSAGLIFPQTALKGRFVFSSRQLEKWQIKLSEVLSRSAELLD